MKNIVHVPDILVKILSISIQIVKSSTEAFLLLSNSHNARAPSFATQLRPVRHTLEEMLGSGLVVFSGPANDLMQDHAVASVLQRPDSDDLFSRFATYARQRELVLGAVTCQMCPVH